VGRVTECDGNGNGRLCRDSDCPGGCLEPEGPVMVTTAFKTYTDPKSKRSRISPVSPKRQAEKDERRAVIDATHARSGGRCEARELVPEVECGGPLDCDELAPRSLYPGGHLDLTNTQSLCRRHHDWKETHPTEATARGLMRPAPPLLKPCAARPTREEAPDVRDQ